MFLVTFKNIKLNESMIRNHSETKFKKSDM